MMMRKVGRKPLGRDVLEEGKGVLRVSPVIEGSRQLKTQRGPLS